MFFLIFFLFDLIFHVIYGQQSELEEAQSGVDFTLLRNEVDEMSETKLSLEQEMIAVDDKLMLCQKTSQIQLVYFHQHCRAYLKI